MIPFLKTVLVFFMSLTEVFAPLTTILFNGGESAYYRAWDSEMAFTEDWIIPLEKTPGEDFVILNITDVQLEDIESNDNNGEIAKKTIDKLVADTQPDLITMTGDNAWGSFAYMQIIDILDSYGIPWAPVMGNHDGQGLLSEFWAGEKFIETENCLFAFGPEDMGHGNYIIGVKENGRYVQTIFMMDTHSGADDGGYDHLWQNQIDWYAWAVKGIKDLAGYNVPSTCFMHIPCYEYKIAWDEAQYNETTGKYDNPIYALTSFGVNHEGVCCPQTNNGFFAVCKDLGSTKNMVVGHDHINCSSLLYDGIRLTYGLKTGAGCYWEKEMSGGTTLSINSLGIVKTEHVYINPEEIFGITEHG